MANTEDKLIDEFIESPEPLVPRVDKHVGKKRWGHDTPMFKDKEKASEDLHTTLQVGGMANPLFDAMDALLYATEGKPADALWSLAATVPVADYFINAKRFTKKVIDPALTNIKKGTFVQFNQKLDILGNTGNYVNPKKIILEGKEYIIKTTDDYVADGIKKTLSSGRPAVVVEIHNVTDGHKVYQPFYKSTGTGHSPLSKGNWLPFEGVVPTGMTQNVTIRNGPQAQEPFWSLRGPNVSRSDSWVPRTADNPVGIRNDYVSDGWLLKAFKNKNGEMVNSSIMGKDKIKRGLPIHEDIDLYLRDIWNK